MRPTILVVDDDAATRKMIDTALTASGFDVVAVATAAEALEEIDRSNPDVILLDLILPDGDGIDVCRQVREHSDVSIIMVTAKRDLTDRLTGLDAGADDYVTKPLSMGELVARVKSLLRRRRMREEEQAGEMRYGSVSLQPAQRIGAIEGREARLSEAETGVLSALIQAQGQALSPAQLAEQVWGEGESDAMVLETHIMNLRYKLEEDPQNPRFLVTDPDGGYRIADN